MKYEYQIWALPSGDTYAVRFRPVTAADGSLAAGLLTDRQYDPLVIDAVCGPLAATEEHQAITEGALASGDLDLNFQREDVDWLREHSDEFVLVGPTDSRTCCICGIEH